ncbi:unnamed protein product [Auanema sp. JU1783]|nr:unnamed protein product [Auanema sp. JU1783]
MIRLFVFPVILLLFLISSSHSQQPSTLKFVQIWFRHGERLPTHFLNLPGDPYPSVYHEISEPGELTNNGVIQEYDLGLEIKKSYGDFIGPYRASELRIWVGEDNRTVTSALAAGAALFPPAEGQKWNPDLPWLPIAVHSDPSLDWVSTGVEHECPVYEKTFFTSSDYQSMTGKLKNQKLLETIKKNLPLIPLHDIRDVNHILDSLYIRNILNDKRLPLPEWAKDISYDIRPVMIEIHERLTNLQSPIIGYHRERVLSYMEDHLQRSVKNKAVFLSGHDTNFMMLGKALGINELKTNLPSFGAHIAIELHEYNQTSYVKFFYTTGVGEPLTEAIPSYCTEICTLQDVQNHNEYQRVLPLDMIKICKGLTMSEQQSIVTGSLIAVLAVLLISTVILTYTTYSYRKQLIQMKDPECQRLL